MSQRRGRQRDLAKERFWRKLVGGYDARRTSVRKWCAAHGVSEPSFYAWRRELQRRDTRPVRETRPAQSDAAPTHAVKLLRVRIAAPSPATARRVTICRGDLRLRVAVEQLRDVLAVLESRGC